MEDRQAYSLICTAVSGKIESMNRLFRHSDLFNSFLLCSALTIASRTSHAAFPPPYPVTFDAGSPSEQNAIVKNAGSTITADSRHAEKGQFWVYGYNVAPGARCRLTLILDRIENTVSPLVSVLGQGNKPLPSRMENDPDGSVSVIWSVPDKWPIGMRQSVLLSAKNGIINLKSSRLTQSLPDANGDGLPDSIQRLLTQGMPSNTRFTTLRSPGLPSTVTFCSQPLSPALDVQTDAIFIDTTGAANVNAWKARGYVVWTTADAKASKEYLVKNPEDGQIGRDGKVISMGERVPLATTASVLAADKSLFDALSGSDGLCLVEPEYLTNAGYEPVFKQWWQTQFKRAWREPVTNIDTRFHAGSLMADSETNRVQMLMQSVFQSKPGARRMVTLHSPLYTAQTGLVSPIDRIAGLNEVTDVFGDVNTTTAALPARYAGLRQEMTFARAYLEYSAIFQAARGMNKRVWFGMDSMLDPAHPVSPDMRGRFEQTLIAALLLPDVSAYQLTLPSNSLTNGLTTEETTRLQSILAALEDMHTQNSLSGNAEKQADIGVLISDSAQWQSPIQNKESKSGDLDAVFGLSLPLLQRGIPVQLLSLDRAADPGYLSNFKTLLVSYDFQKPLNSRTQQSLAEWVRRGGSLLYFGGTDTYNAVSDAWWRQSGYIAPQQELWKQLGLNIGPPSAQAAAAEEPGRYAVILKAATNERDFSNRRLYTLDLTPFMRQSGSVAVRITSLAPNESGGAYVASGELSVNGKVAASFLAGSEIENRFLMYDADSQFDGKFRLAEKGASWTYQFDNLPHNAPVTLTLDIANGFVVSAASSRSDFGHTLLSTGANGALSKLFPRLRIGAAYSATLYALPERSQDNAGGLNGGSSGEAADPVRAAAANFSEAPRRSDMPSGRRQKNSGQEGKNAKPSDTALSVLYTLRDGGSPVWMQNIGRGLILNVGIAPGFFSASARSASLLRALTRFAHQRAGGTYSEPGSLRLRRGRYVIVRTFGEAYTAEGRMIDLLSPTLPVADDRIVPPNSLALLYDLGVPEAEPHVGFVSGRLQAKAETATATAFFVRGPAGTTGIARLHRGSRRLLGARATDWLGRPVPVQAQEDGGTVLLHYANYPDGIIVHIGWQ